MRKGLAGTLAVIALASAGTPTSAQTVRSDQSLLPQVLSDQDQGQTGGGAYCTARTVAGKVVFAAADRAVIKLNGRLVRMQMGRDGFGSDLLLAFDKSAWVEFKPRAGRTSSGEESTSTPMLMKVGRGGRSVSVPVTRTCGA